MTGQDKKRHLLITSKSKENSSAIYSWLLFLAVICRALCLDREQAVQPVGGVVAPWVEA